MDQKREAKEMSGSEDQMGAQAVQAVNQLSYKLPPDLSVATQRNMQSQYFQAQSYAPGSVAVCILNTGSSFVDFNRSVLYIDVMFSGTTAGITGATGGFGPNGSACNLLNRVLICSRSGSVLERIDNANQLASARLYLERSRDYVHNNASVMGANTGTAVPTYGSGTLALGGETVRFALPCCDWSPLFANADALFPSALASGMRIELTLESALNALIYTGATNVPNYQVTAIRLDCECYQLSDMVMRSLNNQASTSSLEVTSVTVHDTQSRRSQSSVNVDCGKACSRALRYLYRERDSRADPTDATFDNFKCLPVTSTYWPVEHQARVGSLYIPQQSIRAGAGAVALSSQKTASWEMFATTLKGIEKLGTGNATETPIVTYMSDRFQIYDSLDRSSVLELAGIPLSNSRLLNVQQSWNVAPARATLIDLYLFHAVLIRCFLTGSNVEV